jgi:phosphatidate cytidylyltransferase
MAILVAVCVAFGKLATLTLWMFVGMLCIDELLINFAGLARKHPLYLSILTFFLLLYMATNIFIDARMTRVCFTIASIVFNFFLMYYLFKIPLEEEFMVKNSKKYPGMLTVVAILPILSFGIYFETDSWRQVLAEILIVTFSMDTGAWFFGKNFGKRKLWPVVSPKKTVEGLIGGMCTSAIIGSVCWYYLFDDYRWYYSGIFAICGALSQVGDLIQSKIKREFKIKDSSNLIPGHGGIYDRIDSLIFLSPFFVIVVKYLGLQNPH